MKTLKLTILMVLMFNTVSNAQGPLKLSLDDAMNYALEHSYNVQLSDIELEIARRKVKETTAIGLPQINASGSFQNFLDIPVQVIPDFISPTVIGTLVQTGVLDPSEVPSSDPQFVEAQFGTKYNVTAGVSASQLLFDGSYIVGLQAAKAYVEFAELNKAKSEHDVKEQVAQAYFTVLVAEENLGVLDESIANLEGILGDTKAMYENGFVEEQDVDQLQLQLNSLKNQSEYAKSQRDVAYYLLRFNLGIPETTDIQLTDSVNSLVEDADHTTLLSQQYSPELDPNVKVVNSALGLQELDAKREKSSYLPSLSASFVHQQQALRNEFNFTDSDKDWFPSTIFGINLNIPIWSSGLRSNRVQQAKLEVEKVKVQKDQITEASQLEYKTAYAEYLNAINQYNNAKESMELSESILEKTQIKYREGVAGSFDLSQAQNQFLSNQGSYIASMLQLLNTKIKLKKSLSQF